MATSEPLFESPVAAAAFGAGLPTVAVGRRLDFHPITDSTNELAGLLAREGAPHGLVVAADQQTAGRGRRGHSWVAPPRRALLFSVLLRYTDLPAARLGWLALGAGLACAEALELAAGVPATIKWPNDIVVPAADGPAPWRKLGGILCEGVAPKTPGTDGYVVAGIGLNILQQADEFPPLPKAPPTSVRMETGLCSDRRAVLAAALERVERAFRALQTDDGFAGLRARVQERLENWWHGRLLTVRAGENPARGRYRGLDDFGRLLLAESSGHIAAYADAEITGLD